MSNEEEIEYEVDYNSFSEYIQSAYFALSSIDNIDEEILPSQAAKNRIKRIRFKSLRMIDFAINELYAELFGDEDSE
jgi:hypothetical protein